MANRRGQAIKGGGNTAWRVEADDFTRLMRDAKAFDRDLGLRLRRNIRAAAKPAVDDVKRTVLEPPPGDRPGSVGTRAAIAKGVSLRIGTGLKGGAVTITASARALPPKRKAMLRLYNKPGGWRHPVFGKDTWVHQQGRPYFGSVILDHQAQIRAAVELALDQAASAVGRHR